ncbi:MAG: TMEM175 family protein [Lentilactobacillus diolivorans]|uniref:TMEM175 family protein n=1 Tax=Lentilactobacillus diolivorans TaxID=179838 RepID=UPI0039EA57F0
MQKKLKDRLDVFVDAIIAILITVMVLELPIEITNGVLNYQSLFTAIGIYAVSFCFIANLWYQHAVIFNEVEKVSNGLVVIDLILIFFASLIPTFTRLMAIDTNSMTVVMYGVLDLIISVLFRRIVRSIVHDKYTDKDDMRKLYNVIYGRAFYESWVSYAVLIVIGYFLPKFSLILFIIIPIRSFIRHAADNEEFNDIGDLGSHGREAFVNLSASQRRLFKCLAHDYRNRTRTIGSNPEAQKQAWQDFSQQVEKELNLSAADVMKWSHQDHHQGRERD